MPSHTAGPVPGHAAQHSTLFFRLLVTLHFIYPLTLPFRLPTISVTPPELYVAWVCLFSCKMLHVAVAAPSRVGTVSCLGKNISYKYISYACYKSKIF